MRRFEASTRKSDSRRGSVLLAVLVIVAMLSLGAYTFSHTMVIEAEGTAMFGRGVQARMFADSAVEMVIALLGTAADPASANYYNDPDLFQSYPVRDATTARGRGYFSVIAPVENDLAAQSIRFGLIDESSKLNLNALLSNNADETAARETLMYLPDMTEEIADSILDWLDKDDEPREFGAESDYYLTLASPYEAKNGPIESLDELLLVDGVTPELLYGEDANRNGLLDSNENDSDESLPYDNADGLLQLGLSAYLTVYSRESNLRYDGSERINVGQSKLTELYDQVAEVFDEDTARFVVAYRMYGPTSTGQEEASESNTNGSDSESSSQSEQQMRQAAEKLGQALFGSNNGQKASITRGGMDLSQGGQFQVKSLFDLVGAEVEAQVDGKQTTLASPWSDDPAEMQEYLPDFLDTLTTIDGPFREGRINVNQAREEVLLGVPGITEELVQAILGAQGFASTGEPLGDTTGTRTTIGWLLVEGLVELDQMRALEPYMTVRGGVYRAQVVGYFEEGGPFTRLEAVIDASELPPRLVGLRDLNDLGKGYSRQQLGVGM